MQNENLKQKIAIIGAGAVGSAVAYTLMAKNLGSEIVLVDIDGDKALGEVLDIRDGLSFSEIEKVRAGSYKDAADADIVVLAAGVAQKPGENRLDLVSKNKSIAQSIFKEIGKIKNSAIVIVVSNPVDVIAHLAGEISGLPKAQVFGTGTCLDTARLRSILADKFSVDSKQVGGFVLGEHGDSEFIAWDSVSIGGKLAKEDLSQGEMNEIEEKVKREAYEIIKKKGATYYGIAMTVADIIESILFDQNKILPVSHNLIDWNGASGVCLGAPAVLGRGGIIKSWDLELSSGEKEKMKKSASIIKQYL